MYTVVFLGGKQPIFYTKTRIHPFFLPHTKKPHVNYNKVVIIPHILGCIKLKVV